MNKPFVRPLKKIDATDRTVGRLATEIALALRGKDQPDFLPHLDRGAIVEVSNISKLKFTGKKLEQKTYFHHSGHPGGLKEKKMGKIFQTNPGEVLQRAVREMLPATRLRPGMLKRLIIK